MNPWTWLRSAWRRIGESEPPMGGEMFRLHDRDARPPAVLGETVLSVEPVALDRRALVRGIAAALFAGAIRPPELLRRGSFAPPATAWDSASSDPLADFLAAKKMIEERTGLAPNLLILGSMHRTYVLDRFGVDIADAKLREEIAAELGCVVQFSAAR